MDRNLIVMLVCLSVWAILAIKETVEHVACIQSGGDVVLGWIQDGCAARPEGEGK